MTQAHIQPGCLATVGYEIVQVGRRARPSMGREMRHTSAGRIAESHLSPVSAPEAKKLLAKGYAERRSARL